MSVAYAEKGLLGILTPQANTTVEPEMNLLLPHGYAAITARMTSAARPMDERLVSYFENLEGTIRQFANAPIGAVGFACTGSSYLVGSVREKALLDTISQRLGVPVISAAGAIVDALAALGARRIGLVSPYDESLTQASIAYWSSRGLAVVAVVPVASDAAAFHPIYALSPDSAARALGRFEGAELDAVLLLGTGMPTLSAMSTTPYLGDAPVMSSTLCLAWRVVDASGGKPPSTASLNSWLNPGEWRTRVVRRVAG